jgi:hypothetical protein
MNNSDEETQLLSECIVLATRLAKSVQKKCASGIYKADALGCVNEALHSLGRCRDYLLEADGEQGVTPRRSP